jgi:hypothetical protein
MNAIVNAFLSLLGAIVLAALTLAFDLALNGISTVQASFQMQAAVAFAVVVAFFVGTILSAALIDARHDLAKGMTAQAADVCLRWGLAGVILYTLGPLSNVDYALQNVDRQFVVMLHFHALGALSSLAVLYWGMRRMSMTARKEAGDGEKSHQNADYNDR